MKLLLITVIALPFIVVWTLFFAAPAWADPTDSGIRHNPGLQQACALNPAFNKAHASACAPYTVEVVASNGNRGLPNTNRSGN